MDGRANCRNKAVFSNYFRIVWMLPKRAKSVCICQILSILQNVELFQDNSIYVNSCIKFNE